MKTRVIVNVPPLDSVGGVAGFYANLHGRFGDDVLYLYTGRRIGELRMLAGLRLVSDYLRFVWLLWKRDCDVVHVNPSLRRGAVWRDAVFIMIARAFGKRTVAFIHGWDENYEKAIRKRGMSVFRLTYFRADALIVLGKECRASLHSMGYRRQIEVMTTAFDASLVSMAGAYQVRNVSSEPFRVLFLARIERQKGILEALQAVAILAAKHGNVEMTVAGIGGALDVAKQYARDLMMSGVRFVGYVRGAEKAEVFNQAHCYLFPSYAEGMPVSVIEAMAFGIPVVSRAVGGLLDFFRDGEMGFLADSSDPTELARLVERLLLDPELCEKMSKTNKAYAARHFAPDTVAERLGRIYSSVARSAWAKQIGKCDLW